MKIKQSKVSKKLNRKVEVYTSKYLKWCSVATDKQIENAAKNKFKEEYSSGRLSYLSPGFALTAANFQDTFENWDKFYGHSGTMRLAKEVKYLIKNGDIPLSTAQRFAAAEERMVVLEVTDFFDNFRCSMHREVFNSAIASLDDGSMQSHIIEKILDFMKVFNLAKNVIATNARRQRLGQMNAPNNILQGEALRLVRLEPEVDKEVRRVMRSSRVRDNIASLFLSDYFGKFDFEASSVMHSTVDYVREVLSSQDDIYHSRKIVDGCVFMGKRR